MTNYQGPYPQQGEQTHRKKSGHESILAIVATVLASIALIVSCCSIALALAALNTESASDNTAERLSEEESGDNSTVTATYDVASQPLEVDATSSIDDGSWHVKVTSATASTAKSDDNSEAETVLDITYEVTNNTAESSAHYISFQFEAYQNGVQLETNYANGTEYPGKVQPGTTITQHEYFTLADSSAAIDVILSYSGENPTSATWNVM